MIIYLTISCITLCFCVITYLWVRHKRESKKEVALADELIEDENGIIVTRESYQECYYTIRRSDMMTHRWEVVDGMLKPTDKLSPKKRMKVHKIDQGIRKETFVSPRLSYGKWRDRQ